MGVMLSHRRGPRWEPLLWRPIWGSSSSGSSVRPAMSSWRGSQVWSAQLCGRRSWSPTTLGNPTRVGRALGRRRRNPQAPAGRGGAGDAPAAEGHGAWSGAAFPHIKPNANARRKAR